jgi:hypothetical protein
VASIFHRNNQYNGSLGVDRLLWSTRIQFLIPDGIKISTYSDKFKSFCTRQFFAQKQVRQDDDSPEESHKLQEQHHPNAISESSHSADKKSITVQWLI